MAQHPAQVDAQATAAAWNDVAQGYREYWSGRFRPLLEAAVAQFEPPPRGPIAVPGCGPGDEIALILGKLPGRALIATDPSPEMVAMCRAALRQAGLTTALATTGRAEDLSGTVHQAAGVFSSFTLQLLPDPPRALADWSAALRLGGVVTAVFWPWPEPASSFGRLAAAITRVTGEERAPWEARTLLGLGAAGLAMRRDERLHTTFEHSGPEELFDAIVDKGPLRLLRTRRGDAVIAAIRAEWLKSPALSRAGSVWQNPVEARLWCLEKVAEPAGAAH